MIARLASLMRIFGIESGERRIFAWGAFALFLLGWADVSVKNVAEVLFLKRVGVELMPLAFLVSSFLLVASTSAFGPFAARHDRLVLLPRVFLALGILVVPLWLLVSLGLESAFGLLLIASKQMTSIALLVFWIAMGDLLHGRQTKRLFAPMMAGVTVGTISGSFASKPIGESLGIAGLLPVAGVLLLLASAATWRLRTLRSGLERLRPTLPSIAEPVGDRAETAAPFASLWREHALVRLLLMTMLCSGLLGPMLYFQFQYVADLATLGHGGEQKLLAFYAQFRGWIYGAVLVIQLVGAGRIYRRIGLPLAAAVSPLVYLAGFTGLSLSLSLPAGVAAMAGTKVQDEAIYDPALRVLYGLLPEKIRARATAFIEGPVKRGGGAFGNAAIVAALALGSPAWVGYLALPIALVWLVASLRLWRTYPRLLLNTAAASSTRRQDLQNELLDATTVHTLVSEMSGQDTERARLAIELVVGAEARLAAPALVEAAVRASGATRDEVIAALDARLDEAATESVEHPHAAQRLGRIYDDDGAGLGDAVRAALIRACARLQRDPSVVPLLQRALHDAAPAVRLVARVALERRKAASSDAPALTPLLENALRAEDVVLRRAARKELRAALLCEPQDDQWTDWLRLLVEEFLANVDREEAGEALADIAQCHGTRLEESAKAVLAARDDPRPRVRAALLRWAGFTRQRDQVAWLVDQMLSEDGACAAASREGLFALGSESSAVLLRELAYGKRSKREAIIEMMHELALRPEELRELYAAELDSVERDLSSLVALRGRAPLDLLRQRLAERAGETLHTALLFLGAIQDEKRIAELGTRLWQLRERPRERAVLIEALESLLPPADGRRLLPLLEEEGSGVVARNSVRAPARDVERTLGRLREDAEDLTRTIATGLAAASGSSKEESDAVDAVEKMAHLKKVSLFADLSARELMDLAHVVAEKRYEPGVRIFGRGAYDDCLYVVVEGVVQIDREDTLLAELGPSEFFGEVALLEGGARSANAVARTHVRLLGLDRTDFMKLIDERPAIAVRLLQTLSRRVRELTDRLLV
jgi:hypothetical protein